jgi:hypothetical protein
VNEFPRVSAMMSTEAMGVNLIEAIDFGWQSGRATRQARQLEGR